MNTETMPYKRVHHGRNIKRLREMLGVKQEAIAIALDMSQQNMSLLEQKEEIEDKILEKIAKVLNVPAEAIKNMNDDMTISYINTFNDSVTNNNGSPFSYNYNCNFNPIDKIVELYDKLLQSEKEKIVMLQEVLRDKK